MASSTTETKRRGIFKTKEERGKWWSLSSVEIGYTAAFGGLGFALRALGIAITIGPGLLLEPRDVLMVVGPAFTGPIGALLMGAVAALPSAFMTVQAYAPLAFVFALIYKIFRHPWYYVGIVLALIFVWAGWWSYWYEWYGWMPFITSFGLFQVMNAVYIPSSIIVMELIRRYSPVARRIVG